MAYRKIPKISPGANIFQRPFLRGLYSEGLIYGEKFAFQNRLEGNLPLTFLLCFTFVFEGKFQVQAPGGLVFGGAISLRVFALRVWGAGLIFGGAYFRNFTILLQVNPRSDVHTNSCLYRGKRGGGGMEPPSAPLPACRRLLFQQRV